MPDVVGRVCVYCGSRAGTDPLYKDMAVTLGRVLVKRRLALVYGGGSTGLMGALADSVLSDGGHVIGIIPTFLATKELLHTGISETQVTKDIQERKAIMAKHADAFVALPGGFGTFEEVLEILTWRQLAIHDKPIVLLNTNAYFDSLINLIDRAISDGFMTTEHRRLFSIAKSPEEAISIVTRQLQFSTT